MVPPWEAVLAGLRPGHEDDEILWSRSMGGRSLRHGQCTNTEWHGSSWPNLTDPERALWRSQRGPLASNVLMAFPTSRSTRIDPQLFRVLLCRRLQLPLPFSSRTCRCGRLLDCRGHHRAACAEAGFWEQGDLHWSGQPHRCAEKEVVACRRM